MQFEQVHAQPQATHAATSCHDYPYSGVDLSEALACNAALRPQAVAFREIDGAGIEIAQLDWLGCWRSVRALAAKLSAALRPGDRVLIPQGRPIAFATFLLASMEAGMTAVPVAHPRHPRRMEALLAIARDCGAAAMLVEPGQQELFAAPLAAIGMCLIEAGEAADVEAVPMPDPVLRNVSRDAPAWLQYTSGSTSQPKGVVIGRDNVVANAAAIVDALAVTEQSRFLSWLPLFHDMGLVTSIAVPILAGAESLFMPARAFSRDPGLWLELIGRYRVSHAGGPDFGFNLCVERVDDDRLAAFWGRSRSTKRHWRALPRALRRPVSILLPSSPAMVWRK